MQTIETLEDDFGDKPEWLSKTLEVDGVLENARLELFGAIEVYAETREQSDASALAECVQQLGSAFIDEAEFIIGSNIPNSDKASILLGIHERENRERVLVINSVTELSLEPTLFGNNSEIEDDEFDDIEFTDEIRAEILEGEVETFLTSLQDDLNAFLEYCNSQPQPKKTVIKEALRTKAEEVTTIAVGVTIGILAAKKLGKRI